MPGGRDQGAGRSVPGGTKAERALGSAVSRALKDERALQEKAQGTASAPSVAA